MKLFGICEVFLNYTFWRVFGGPGVIDVQLVNVVSRVLMQKILRYFVKEGKVITIPLKKTVVVNT